MRKLLLVLLIAFVGAGIAFGASTVFFSSSPDEESDVVDPQGLVDELATDEPDDPSPSPNATPKASARPASAGGSGTSGGSGSGAAAAGATEEDAAPQSEGAGQVINSQNGVVVTEGDGFSEECRDEDSEEERERCEDDLEAEAEADEEEAEQEAEEDEEKNKD